MLPGAGTCSRAMPLPTICSAKPAVPADSTATRSGSPRNEGTPTRWRSIDHDAVAGNMRLARGATAAARGRRIFFASAACTGTVGEGGAGGGQIFAAFAGLLAVGACACSVHRTSARWPRKALAADRLPCREADHPQADC